MVAMNDQQVRILGCDFGSGGLTVGLYNPHTNRTEAFGACEYRHRTGLANSRWLEQDPRDWLQAIPRAMAELRSQVELDSLKIAGIGIGAHMHALVLLDGHNEPVTEDGDLLCGAIMWNDPRGEEQGQSLSEALGEPIPARMTASRIRWFYEQYHDVWDGRVHRVTVPSSYVALQITGQFGVGPGDASGMVGQLGPDGQFDPAKLERIAPHLSQRMPRVGLAGEVLGVLNAGGAKLFALPEGIPVAYPEGDQPVGMVASGCVRTGQASVSLGNSVVFNAVAAEPKLNQRGIIDSFRTATNDHLLMTCVTSGCVVYDEIVRLFAPLWNGSKDALRDWLASEARNVPPGCNGVMALPFYLGEGVFSAPDAFASFLGLRAGDLTPGVLARASMEANSLMMRYGYHKMGLGGLKQIVLSGGGSKNTLWPQIIADIFQVQVCKPQDAEEAATRGAAYLALVMAKRQAGEQVTLEEMLAERVRLEEPIQPRSEPQEVYDTMLRAFAKTLEQLTPLYTNPWYKQSEEA